MSTNSRIGIKHEDGSVTAVYCHWDGYPDYNGRMLCRFYETREKAESLIALGGLSSIRARLAPEPGELHTFSDAQKDVTIAYHRDRDEDFEQEKFSNSKDYYRSTCDYRYMFYDGYWFVHGFDIDSWVPLEL